MSSEVEPKKKRGLSIMFFLLVIIAISSTVSITSYNKRKTAEPTASPPAVETAR